MKPNEFWECTYREMILYCEINSIKQNEIFKSDIILQEAVTNKLIQADAMTMGRKAKTIPLRKMFKNLFK